MQKPILNHKFLPNLFTVVEFNVFGARYKVLFMPIVGNHTDKLAVHFMMFRKIKPVCQIIHNIIGNIYFIHNKPPLKLMLSI